MRRSVVSNLNLGRSASYCLVLALAASGCATAVTRYYTLSASIPETPAARVAESAVLVGVGPVELPDYVDIPNLVVRTGDNTLDQATFDQWGGSLDDMIPRVLVENMHARMPSDHFVAFPQSGDLPFDFRVPVTISRFDVSTAGEAVVVARWQIRGKSGSGTLVVRETVARAEGGGSSYAARVAALSRALGVLTDEITAALRAQPRPKVRPAR
jgi:uncharacterized lipoprotein YmbA